MIAAKLLQRKEWEKKLRALGCKRALKRKKNETREIWQTQDRLWFTVPVDNEEGMLRDDDLRTVLAQIRRLEDGPHEV